MLPLGLILLIVALVSGCNSSALYQDSSYNPPVYWGQHVVKRGETLYSIAWRYGRDYRELGNANGISPPYHIQAGQVLRLDLRGTVTSTRHTASNNQAPSGRRSDGAAARGSAEDRASTPVTPRPSRPGTASGRTQTVSNIQWRWPHVGTVIAGFSTSGKVNKGLDIAGNSGDRVRAAAAGNVVYAGSGLLGYGNLIIVNHNEQYLSAYAHNRTILVQEGEDVEAGQVIAELGSSGADRPKLHFEIRKNGNPVDPARYLPPR
ncbi:peptidoglycan DD-metalloendopeptidase family protein [Marinobacter sp.]|uniref:peptidoglycan DD-metalloendopeptidase family protein n=1 Tax=Marinobacter sp. TaxID=50741 RepID=UPI0039A4BE06